MNYAEPIYPREDVNKAGKILCGFVDTPEELLHAIDIIDNWRASHAYPLQVFYVRLKERACRIHPAAFVAQRTKRIESIANKLRDKSDMKLSQMQDIGGCRAVLPGIQYVRALESLYKSSRLSHDALVPKDYIQHPKENGYRSVHLKYRYVGLGAKSVFSGLKVEIQLRTGLQHQWATAVEAADVFTNQGLKADKGRQEWRRFFALMSSVFALRERCPLVPNTPTTLSDLSAEIQELNSKHHILTTFMGYRNIITHIERRKDAKYFLVILDPITKTVRVTGFTERQSQLANKKYTETEQELGENSVTKVVLVSVSSIKLLKKAYPNYFLDTNSFVREVISVLNKKNRTPK